MAGAVGKLVNISEDMNSIDKVAEGIFKMLVAGETIMVERKFKDPFPWTVTTKWIYSTNQFPRFSDKSLGTMRRIIAITFNQNFTENGKARLEFSTAEFWQSTGELPLIFNWAIDGLRDLLASGQFLETANSKGAKDNFKREINPAAIFLDDTVEINLGGELGATRLYEEYVSWARENGYVPMASGNFAKEVRRMFPTVEYSGNPRNYNGRRQRVWSGIRAKMVEREIGHLAVVKESPF